MPRINQLPPSVVTKIAAGEVIERPASVVKELLENSVDARSTRIELDVDQGGVGLIRVVDNGYGIHPDDLPLAFASHATSKLTDAEDLFHIGTMGFRGEALASVGGVAQVLIQSRLHESARGCQIRCHGGDLGEVSAWNGSPGTRVEVKHLFFNTPVRKKFLRTTTTEMGHVSETFTRIALAHPCIHLILRHNDRLLHELPSGESLSGETLRERIGRFFGRDVRDQLYEIEATQGLMTLRGFIADPACERGSAKMQYVFLNGRWIRDRTIAHAIQEAYRGLLMTGRYAVAFLFLEMPPDEVDVNVHPTKAEVRFVNSQPVHRLVFAAIRERLREENLTAKLQPPSGGAERAPSQVGGEGSVPPMPFPEAPPREPQLPLPSSLPDTTSVPTIFPSPEEEAPVESGPVSEKPTESEPLPEESPGPQWPRASDLPVDTGPTKVIQLYDAYLVMETPEGMLVVDQHALHERILFEQIKKRVGEGDLETQRLLIPEPVELTAEQCAKAIEHQDAIKELGLEVEDFGNGTIVVNSYPAILSRHSPEKILKAVVDHLLSKDRPPTREVLLNDLFSLMACHAAVRAGDRLTPDQMTALVEQRHLVDDTHHCPHGRPTALLFTRQDLDRQFRRA